MSSSASSETGFSLVETIAALGILSLAAVPLMQVASDATRNAAYLEERLLARTVAENVLSRAIADPLPIEGGVASGTETQLGRRFAWTLTASPARQGEIQSLDVLVREGDQEQVLVTMTSLKAVPRPVAPIDEAATQDTPKDQDDEDKE